MKIGKLFLGACSLLLILACNSDSLVVSDLSSDKIKKIFILIFLTFFLFIACKKDDLGYLEFNYFITTEKCMTCTPYEPFINEVEGLMTKGEFDVWTCSAVPYIIKGFEYQDGYEYELLVRKTFLKDDPQKNDEPLFSYSLITLISMTPVASSE